MVTVSALCAICVHVYLHNFRGRWVVSTGLENGGVKRLLLKPIS
jgi:hypothetical protein